MNEPAIAGSAPIEKIVFISKNDFIVLNFLTFNLYGVWWTYKCWRFFRDKDFLDIRPAMRALFSVFFLYSLFAKVKRFASLNGNVANYSSILLYFGVLLFAALSYLPSPYFILGSLAFICYVPVVQAFNEGIRDLDNHEIQTGFNARQTVLLVLGAGFWMLVLLGFLLTLLGNPN